MAGSVNAATVRHTLGFLAASFSRVENADLPSAPPIGLPVNRFPHLAEDSRQAHKQKCNGGCGAIQGAPDVSKILAELSHRQSCGGLLSVVDLGLFDKPVVVIVEFDLGHPEGLDVLKELRA
jgi:hypothetical protein